MLKAVTILLPFAFLLPPAGKVKLWVIKVTPKLVLVVKFVKVLLLMFEFRTTANVLIRETAVVPLILKLTSVKLLPFILLVVVALPFIASTIIPCKVVAAAPARSAITLLLMLLAMVPSGTTEAAGTKTARKVPEFVAVGIIVAVEEAIELNDTLKFLLLRINTPLTDAETFA